MDHPKSVLETHSKDDGFKAHSCSAEDRKKIADKILSIMNKRDEMRKQFSSKDLFLQIVDVIVNLILALIHSVK